MVTGDFARLSRDPFGSEVCALVVQTCPLGDFQNFLEMVDGKLHEYMSHEHSAKVAQAMADRCEREEALEEASCGKDVSRAVQEEPSRRAFSHEASLASSEDGSPFTNEDAHTKNRVSADHDKLPSSTPRPVDRATESHSIETKQEVPVPMVTELTAPKAAEVPVPMATGLRAPMVAEVPVPMATGLTAPMATEVLVPVHAEAPLSSRRSKGTTLPCLLKQPCRPTSGSRPPPAQLNVANLPDFPRFNRVTSERRNLSTPNVLSSLQSSACNSSPANPALNGSLPAQVPGDMWPTLKDTRLVKKVSCASAKPPPVKCAMHVKPPAKVVSQIRAGQSEKVGHNTLKPNPNILVSAQSSSSIFNSGLANPALNGSLTAHAPGDMWPTLKDTRLMTKVGGESAKPPPARGVMHVKPPAKGVSQIRAGQSQKVGHNSLKPNPKVLSSLQSSSSDSSPAIPALNGSLPAHVPGDMWPTLKDTRLMTKVGGASPHHRETTVPSKITTLRAYIDARHIGGLFGKRGTTMLGIQRDSGAKIHVDGKHGDSHRIMNIRGDFPQVTKALRLVLETIAKAIIVRIYRAREKTADIRGDEDFLQEVYSDKMPTLKFEFTIVVPERHIGAILGVRGRIIDETCSMSGAFIRVMKPSDLSPNSEERTIEISGTHASIAAAVERMMGQLADEEEKKERRSSSSVIPSHSQSDLFPLATGSGTCGGASQRRSERYRTAHRRPYVEDSRDRKADARHFEHLMGSDTAPAQSSSDEEKLSTVQDESTSGGSGCSSDQEQASDAHPGDGMYHRSTTGFGLKEDNPNTLQTEDTKATSRRRKRRRNRARMQAAAAVVPTASEYQEDFGQQDDETAEFTALDYFVGMCTII